jgi:two-component system, chemotaxis family, protein-glutamate methylesterase/glutaminase
MEKQRVLIVDDESSSVRILKRILSAKDYILDDASNGNEALAKLKKNHYHALLTDWLMPGTNGVQLIQHVRKNIKNQPIIIMTTVIDSLQAKEDILEIGADYYLSKPYDLKELISYLEEGLARMQQSPHNLNLISPQEKQVDLPPFIAVVLASSTAGCEALRKVFHSFPSCNAAFFIVQHGPKWVIEELARQIQINTELNVKVAEDSLKIQPGYLYIAPADSHLCIQRESFSIQLSNDPKENFLRPAADPLFRTAAKAFGRFTIGVVLTGLGMDGTYGSAHIVATKGIVIAQDPKTAVASTMPGTVISSGLALEGVPLNNMQTTILEEVKKLSKQLDRMQ